ncbi:MAG: citrate transporter [Lachnospiraceae bacterium]|nr:citrate transporter [Lachnospiraceae bacterium]
MKKSWINNLRKLDTVLVISGVLAILSMFINPPGREYLEFIDVRVLCLLFSLMAVIGGLGQEGIFEKAAAVLAGRAGTLRMLAYILVGLCFFSSMFITNDVALITFVPMTIFMLRGHRQKQMILVIVLETIGANLGSMLLPFGNPQNLYIYGKYNMGLAEFLITMLPVWLFSLVLLAVLIRVLIPGEALGLTGEQENVGERAQKEPTHMVRSKRNVILYCILFVVCICGVLRFLPYYVVLLLVVAVFLAVAPGVLRKVDYGLLLTFLFFFIFVGNLSRIETVQQVAKELLEGRVVLASALISQVISNVPAALMLSGFTGEGAQLLLGVNIGGLGTLIASMASLISYKYYKASPEADGKGYFLWFTGLNVLLLVIFLVLQRFLPV